MEFIIGIILYLIIGIVITEYLLQCVYHGTFATNNHDAEYLVDILLWPLNFLFIFLTIK